MSREETVLQLGTILKENMKHHWEWKESIIQMKNQNYAHWKHMEWIGFYFEFLCQAAFGILN